MATVHLLIKGKVQGVFYRGSAKEMAEKLGITGWVRNTHDGDVEIMASGSEGSIAAFTDWCRQGPPSATVSNVVITSLEEESFPGFKIVRR